MRTLFAVVAVLHLALPIFAIGQTVADAQKMAVARYPDLSRENSPFHAKFMELFQDAKRTNPALLNDPNWPMAFAEKVSAMLATQAAQPPVSSDAVPKPAELEEIEKAASQGEAGTRGAEAQFKIGEMYRRGDQDLPQSAAKALEWFEKAASQGNANAQSRLANMYNYGDGLPADFDKSVRYIKALEWNQQAAEQGDNIASKLGLGRQYRNPDGFGIIDKAASEGSAEAEFQLGLLYEQGRGVPKSDAKALEWYQKAAALGHATAQCNIASMYQAGKGVPKDEAKATEWYQKAAAKGNARAQFRLGLQYDNGQGVPLNAAKATEWLLKAATKGYPPNALLQNWLQTASKDGRPPVDLFQSEFPTGKAAALFNIAVMYSQTQVVPKNEAKSLWWLHKAGSEGSTVSQRKLGGLYANGKAVQKDWVRAYAWFDLAALTKDHPNQEDRRMRDEIQKQMTPQQLAQAQKLSADLFETISKKSTLAKETVDQAIAAEKKLAQQVPDEAAKEAAESVFTEGRERGIPDCKVVQALKEGLLLNADRIDKRPGFASVIAQDPVLILLTGYPDSVIDGERTSYCIAKYSGTFEYETAIGAKKTIRAFKFVRSGMK